MVITERISLSTKGDGDMRDITPQVEEKLTRSGAQNGTVTVFVTGSTAGVTTIEYEPGLVADFQAFWQKVIPKGIPYHHDQTWGDANGYSHVRASLLGASLVIPFQKGKLALGTWQQVVLVDFDNRPRSREVVVQIMGG